MYFPFFLAFNIRLAFFLLLVILKRCGAHQYITYDEAYISSCMYAWTHVGFFLKRPSLFHIFESLTTSSVF